MQTGTLGVLAAVTLAAAPAAAQLFGPGDTFLAVDLDVGTFSNYPGGEPPINIFDQDPTTKYLNFAKEGSGVIVTPAGGATAIQCILFTTANDAPARDPASYEVYGTNDPIASLDNSDGTGENWTLIDAADLDLPMDRFISGAFHNFSNATAYTSYKIVVPTVREACNANSMQIGEIQVFTEFDGGGLPVFNFGDNALAISAVRSQSAYPCNENPPLAFDGDVNTKYLNHGGHNTGVIMERADQQATVVGSFTLTTANDFDPRDPNSWELYGTNDAVTSADNSDGTGENWTLIDSGSIDLPLDRFTQSGPVSVNGAGDSYSAYMMIFPTLRGGVNEGMQIAEITLYEAGPDTCAADLAPAPNGDGQVNTNDFFQFLSYYQTQDPGADFSPAGGDGNINTNDFFAFLAAYQDALTNGC